MAGETVITIVGNLTDDPELRFTPSGAAVANFRVASTPRTYNKQTDSWEDGDPLFLSCAVWRQYGENVAESLQRGSRVIVTGKLRQRSYETNDGEKRTVYEIDVEEIGPSLKWATAKVTKVSRDGGTGPTGGGQQSAGGSDPWSTAGQQPPPVGRTSYRSDPTTGRKGIPVSFPEPPAASNHGSDLAYLSALADYIDAAGDAARKAGLRGKPPSPGCTTRGSSRGGSPEPPASTTHSYRGWRVARNDDPGAATRAADRSDGASHHPHRLPGHRPLDEGHLPARRRDSPVGVARDYRPRVGQAGPAVGNVTSFARLGNRRRHADRSPTADRPRPGDSRRVA